MTKDKLDNLVDNIDLNEKTELEGMAEQMFSAKNTNTFLDDEEIGLAWSTGIIFKALSMEKHDPVQRFLELKKSLRGWSTDKFVQSVGGVNEQRAAGGFGGFIKDRLFTPKQ